MMNYSESLLCSETLTVHVQLEEMAEGNFLHNGKNR